MNFARRLAVSCLASLSVAGPIERNLAAEFNMAVMAAGIRLGGHVSGPLLAADSLANRVVLLETGERRGGMDFQGIPHCMLFDHTGRCVYRGSPFSAQEAVVVAVKAAPGAVLEGRTLAKLEQMRAYVRDQLGVDADGKVTPETSTRIPVAMKGQIRSLAQEIGKSVPGSPLADKASAIAAEIAP